MISAIPAGPPEASGQTIGKRAEGTGTGSTPADHVRGPMTCTHGMPTPASCIDCMDDDGLGAPTTTLERLEGPSIESRYDTECRKCDGSIRVGERVHLTDAGRWVCARCIEEIRGGT